MKKQDRQFPILILLVTVLIMTVSCTVNNSGEESGGPVELNESAKKIVKAENEFSLNVFKEVVVNDGKENTFISPLSISMALGMTMNGARGETFIEMRDVLGFTELEQPEINEGYKNLSEGLISADKKVQLELANSVWSRSGFNIQEDFSGTLKEYFNAKAAELDFSDPSAKDEINDWVSENTHGKIPTIIESIPSNIVMYLINAVYFKGSWSSEFDPENTSEKSFDLENGEVIQTEMMNQTKRFPRYFNKDVQMVDLPYGDSLFSMTVMKPADPEVKINDFIENTLTTSNLNLWVDSLITGGITVLLPKLDLEYELQLNSVLVDMGMPTAFSDNADLSGINGTGGLTISEVKHKTYLKVDEEGTEAVAVTSVGVGPTGVPPMSFIVFDRSYVMMIRERSTGTILFVGKVKNPTLKKG